MQKLSALTFAQAAILAWVLFWGATSPKSPCRGFAVQIFNTALSLAAFFYLAWDVTQRGPLLTWRDFLFMPLLLAWIVAWVLHRASRPTVGMLLCLLSWFVLASGVSDFCHWSVGLFIITAATFSLRKLFAPKEADLLFAATYLTGTFVISAAFTYYPIFPVLVLVLALVALIAGSGMRSSRTFGPSSEFQQLIYEVDWTVPILWGVVVAMAFAARFQPWESLRLVGNGLSEILATFVIILTWFFICFGGEKDWPGA